MFSENLNIDSIGVNHELKPRNSRCMHGALLLGTALLKYFLKTDQVFLRLFSFSASTTRDIFDEFINTHRNNFRKKENYDNEKKEIKMS